MPGAEVKNGLGMTSIMAGLAEWFEANRILVKLLVAQHCQIMGGRTDILYWIRIIYITLIITGVPGASQECGTGDRRSPYPKRMSV